MVNISIKYTGHLHCDAEHGPSHAKLATDAPTDNKGKGEAFSPTDLIATALGTCISTTMGIKAEELGVSLKGMTVDVTGAQESAGGNQSADEIFLGRLSPSRTGSWFGTNRPIIFQLDTTTRRSPPRRVRARTAVDNRARHGPCPSPLR